MNTKYPTLARAGLTQNYLHTNSTTHQFLFGAIAELLDNSRDANAKQFDIYTTNDKSVRGGFYLNFLDDGSGMEPKEVNNVVQFGKSFKRNTENMIGQYGNGLKSGSMRIGNDFVLFTKKGTNLSALMLSRTFHDEEQIDAVICPMPVWSSVDNTPVLQESCGIERHKQEVELMCKYSPFKTEGQLLNQFKNIAGASGTLICVYNIKLLDSGYPELDIVTDPYDIKMAEIDQNDLGNYPERMSFKAYASILYLDPRMKIYVQKKKIRTKKLSSTLCEPISFEFTSKRFKKRSEVATEEALNEYNLAESRAREAESKSRDLEKKFGMNNKLDKEEMTALRKMQDKSREARELAKQKLQQYEKKKKSLNDRKSLKFVFGANVENRRYYGMFIYNCSRLIRMYERVGPQINGTSCKGIVGIVNVPYAVLEPTHNKQHFADNKEYRHMLKAMGDHLSCYMTQNREIKLKGEDKFWNQFGYLDTDNWEDKPSTELKYLRIRATKVPTHIQCEICLKWRTLPFQAAMVGKALPEKWTCHMNADRSHNSCQHAEEVQKIKTGKYVKEEKSSMQKKQQLIQKQERINKELRRIDGPQRHKDQLKRPSMTSTPIRPSKQKRQDLSRSDKVPKVPQRLQDKTESSHLNAYASAEKSSLKRKRPSTDDHKKINEEMKKSRPQRELKERSSRHKEKRYYIEADEEEDEEEVTEEFVVGENVPDFAEEDEKPLNSYKEKSHEKPVKAKSCLGKQCEYVVDNKWRVCRVVAQSNSDKSGKVKKYKLKFNDYPQDNYDRTVEVANLNAKNFRWLDGEMDLPHSSKDADKPADDREYRTPGTVEVPLETFQQYQGVFEQLKNCLGYFLPPSWQQNKEHINNLKIEDMATYPMNDFFDAYEKGLRSLVGKYKNSETQHKQELLESQQVVYDLLNTAGEAPEGVTYDDVVSYARTWLHASSQQPQHDGMPEENGHEEE